MTEPTAKERRGAEEERDTLAEIADTVRTQKCPPPVPREAHAIRGVAEQEASPNHSTAVVDFTAWLRRDCARRVRHR